MTHPSVQRAWQDGRAAFGAFSAAFPTDGAIRALAGAGYDFLGIDCQHGLLDETGAGEILRRSADLPCPVIVRVHACHDAAIGRVLDAGADGIIVPMVSTVEEARAAVAACRYPPAGVRSFGPGRADLGVDIAQIEARASCFVMIETREALERAREIAAVPGLAGLFVGPVDLGIALGVPFAAGRTSEVLWSALGAVREACDEAGVVAGCFASGPDHAAKVASEGYRIVSMGAEVRTLVDGARRELAIARGDLPPDATAGYGA
jgi:2-keto-3-deoxy-L-rhamnonate aldolase RhmA